MSKPPKLDDGMFAGLGQREQAVLDEREERVALTGEVAEALLAGRLPSLKARMFVGGALQGCLEHGEHVGDLERKFLRVSSESGSHATLQQLWKKIKRHRD